MRREVSHNAGVWQHPCPVVLDAIPLSGQVRIEASAGTGKTYTLEHLVVDRLIRTEATLPQILVMTFTEKATSELKQRIRKLLTDVLLKSTHMEHAEVFDGATLHLGEDGAAAWWFSDAVRRKLELTLFGFDEAPIFTIHGFCSRILSEQAFYLGEPLLQERVDSKSLFREVWRDYLSDSTSHDSTSLQVIENWLKRKTESSLFALLYDAYTVHYGERSFDPRAHAHTCIEVIADAVILNRFRTEVAHAAITQPARDALKIEVQSLWNIVMEGVGNSVTAQAFDGVVWKRILKPRGTKVTDTKFKFPAGLSSEARTWYDAVYDLSAMVSILNAESFQALDTLLPKLAQRVEMRKRREFLFDYDDLLRRLYEVLVVQNNLTLAQQLQTQYRFALIDEFQDTDEVQWAIIDKIFLRNGHSQLILIGDPKQAIYRFRGAEVETYLNAAKRLETRIGAIPTDVFLDTNYRSSKNLLIGLNLLFEQRTQDPFFSGQIRYSHPVKCGRTELDIETEKGESIPPITLLPFVPVGHGKKVGVTILRDHFLGRLSEEVLALLRPPLIRIRESRVGEARPITPSDIMVLVRTNYEARLVEKAFRKVNLPVSQAPSGSVFCTPEAFAVLDLLRSIAAPAQTALWTRILAGPFFDMPWSQVSELEQIRPASLRLRLEHWHRLSQAGALEQVLHEVYTDTQLECRAAVYSKDDQSLLNIRVVLNQCAIETQKSGLRLNQLIEWLERIIAALEAPPDPYADAPPAPENANSIRILTMHASKGLESPIVFMFGGFSGRPKQLVHRSSALGSTRVFLNESLPQVVEHDVFTKDCEEDERLLYVALTRASVRLYLPFVDTHAAIAGMYEKLNSCLLRLRDEDKLPPSIFSFEREKRHTETHFESPTNPTEFPTVDALTTALRATDKAWIDSSVPITSYSKLKAQAKAQSAPNKTEDFIISEERHPNTLDPDIDTTSLEIGDEAEADAQTLPGGKQMGKVLHDCLEHIDGSNYMNGTREAFLGDKDVQRIVTSALSRHQVSVELCPDVQSLIWTVLNTKLKLGRALVLPKIGSLKMLKEMEFLYPAPATSNATKGYIRGFIDGLFEHDGKYYWLDWKSDRLKDYGRTSLLAHVHENYGIQAELYTLALVRLLRLEDEDSFEQKFGGLIYVYLRGVGACKAPSQSGVFFAKPDYKHVKDFERKWGKQGLYDPPRFTLGGQIDE